MKKIRSSIALILVLIFGLCALAQADVIQFSASDVEGDAFDFAGGEDAVQSSGVVIPTATLSPDVAALPWNLMLVNNRNPVPDDWEIEFVELSNGRRVDARMYPDLQQMFDDCRAAGLTPKVITAYRTYDDQKDMLMVKYRKYRDQGYSHEEAQAMALKVASYPGYSEHQLGLAVDITTANSEKCSSSSVQDWMKKNCAKYGFIWRYPGSKTDITGIDNEDWHFRYVGKEAAAYIMENGLCLEEYLNQEYGIPIF